jgi:WD40 repeat protein
MPTIAPADIEGHCVHAGFIASVPVFAGADGRVYRLEGALRETVQHDGLLCAAESQDRARLYTGGEDGKVNALASDGKSETLGLVPRKWVTAIASGPNASLAWASGKTAWFRDNTGKVREHVLPRSVEGVALAPKGARLALSRYNGVTLIWAAASGAPVELEWKGAHNAVCFSPDGRFVVTSMQENALHGWKLEDGKHMRMTGYPGKVKSWSWSAKGRFLATSGSDAAIVWPFHGKDGPMGKSPMELGARTGLTVTSVACHPVDEICAVGFSDGMILGVRMGDAKEVLLRRGGKGAVSSMSWDAGGHRLAFGSEAGDCGLVDIAG